MLLLVPSVPVLGAALLLLMHRVEGWVETDGPVVPELATA